MDAFNVVIGVLGVLLGVAGLWFALSLTRRAERFARETKQAAHAKLSLGLGGIDFEDVHTRTYLVRPKDERGMYVAEIPLSVTNSGDAAAEGLELVVCGPVDIIRGMDRFVFRLKPGSSSTMSPSHSIEKNLAYFRFQLGALPPKSSIGLKIPFRCVPTRIETTHHAKLRDGSGVNVTAFMEISWVLKFQVTAANHEPTAAWLDMRIFDDEGMPTDRDSLIRQVLEQDGEWKNVLTREYKCVAVTRPKFERAKGATGDVFHEAEANWYVARFSAEDRFTLTAEGEAVQHVSVAVTEVPRFRPELMDFGP